MTLSSTRFVTVLLLLASLLAPQHPVFACQLDGMRHYRCCCHDHGHCRHGGGCPHYKPGKGCCDVDHEPADAGLLPWQGDGPALFLPLASVSLAAPVSLPADDSRRQACRLATDPPPNLFPVAPLYLTSRRLRI
ncbi:hypothetical protein MIT9_P0539 [Methylomarinovum caldicuralii]|uniref:Secreted protein n=1 Tax=Methylomarinovum caldicuralii TaxID=438856 RepID=A0AAU9C691_9GAMM|nr:hypothetical protein [Methylomarinovum caldicuralii]BCX80961.1 hypothetical protein MIT9_P0539 [Methylomarinovum caldicuralii]